MSKTHLNIFMILSYGLYSGCVEKFSVKPTLQIQKSDFDRPRPEWTWQIEVEDQLSIFKLHLYQEK